MDTYTEIKNKIRAMTGQKTPLLLTGKVESVYGETCTVSVGDLRLTDVRLRSVVNGKASKLLITPKTGSYVTLIDLSGELRELEVIGYSEIKAIDIETESDININCNGTVTINEGRNEGMVKILKLTEKLNELVDIFNAHTHTVVGTDMFATMGHTTLPVNGITRKPADIIPHFDRSYYEDEKVKH